MPIIPLRSIAERIRQPSDETIHRRSNDGGTKRLSARAESFNPALIPLLPVETIGTYRNVYIHTKRTSDTHTAEGDAVSLDMEPRAPQPSDLFAPRSPHDPLDSDLSPQSLHQLHARQHTNPLIPAVYKTVNTSPAPGAVAGIVLGAVAGFLVLFWLFFTLIFAGRSGAIEGDESEIVIARHHTHSKHRSKRTHRSSHHSHREMSEAPPPRPPPSRSPSRSPRRRTERIVVEETTRRTERSQPPPPVSPRTERETIIEESRERRVDGDDVVEVIEEHSDVSAPKRKKSGYRTVDPNEYAGGNYPRRDVDGRRRSTKR